jgi:hypothetical protein
VSGAELRTASSSIDLARIGKMPRSLCTAAAVICINARKGHRFYARARPIHVS